MHAVEGPMAVVEFEPGLRVWVCEANALTTRPRRTLKVQLEVQIQ